ncbi:MAG TPA: Clp protease N-terminal domain-containing protein [Pseudonocardiaceae bacterium]
MFERFTDDARGIIVTAREQAVQLGHRFIGCEHLLLAIAATEDPTGAVLRDAGVTPERIRAEIRKMIGPGQDTPGGLFETIDRDALAAIGIDLDVVRSKVEAAFGPNALRPPRVTTRRWWRRPRAGCRPGNRTRTGHIPFTQRAKKSLELSVREMGALHSGHLGVEHLALGLLETKSSAALHILSEIGVTPVGLRTDILNRYRQAS